MKWLDPNLNQEQITQMMTPFDESKMEAYSISKLITSRTESSNQAKVKEPFEYLELLLE
jgi:putative SOS response-associated peptidase YedK